MSDDPAGNGLDPAWCKAMEELGKAVLADAAPAEVARLVQAEADARKDVTNAQS